MSNYRIREVVKAHIGHGLQLRFMRSIERKCREVGCHTIVSDTTDNPASANNFVRAGWTIYQPSGPWSFPQSIYWKKAL